MNAFPSADGVSSKHSPRRLMVGFEVLYSKHDVLPFGSYVHTHEDYANDESQRTLGAMCMGPTGNHKGGHWFMSLTSGSRIRRNHWTKMPMPSEAIGRVNGIGARQKMPTKLACANRHGHEIEDTIDELEYDSSDDDSDYSSSDSDDDDDDSSDESASNDSDSEDDYSDSNDSDDDENDNNPAQRGYDQMLPPPNGVQQNPIINVGAPTQQHPPPARDDQPSQQSTARRAHHVTFCPPQHETTVVEDNSKQLLMDEDDD